MIMTKAGPEDAAEVFALYRSRVGEKNMAPWSDDYPAPENVSGDIESNSLYVLKIDGVIASVCTLGEWEDDEFDKSSFDKSVKKWGELARVGTLREYERRGLSAKLVRFALDDARARGFGGVRLFVNDVAAAAIAHYAKLGVNYCGKTAAYGYSFLCGEFVFGEITVRQATPDELVAVTDILAKLYNEHDYDELLEENRRNLADDTQVILLAADGEKIVGVVHAAIRREYVEGRFDEAPIGYIEGIFVESAYRRRGVARRLAAESESWAKARGCNAMASDCELNNADSLRFHLGVGYSEAGRNIHFIKGLGGR
ncbi:MAG: GNAT family N-acetyltransferase [Oscillospiraceae bacterium]|jgi:aminoglycoside 6'-N-acetyltransferase I|nr:GNAT family N-acetyltransferase [Oscillospiraceae bacterium]